VGSSSWVFTSITYLSLSHSQQGFLRFIFYYTLYLLNWKKVLFLQYLSITPTQSFWIGLPLSELKTVDFIYIYFLIIFLFSDLRLGISVILHMIVTNCYITITLCHILVTWAHVIQKDVENSGTIMLYNMFIIC